MKRLALALTLSVALLALFATVAGAFTMSQKIVVADQLVAITRVPAGGFTPDQRIDRVNERLAVILGYTLSPRRIRAEWVGRDMAITVDHRLLVTVTPADARANGTTVETLAHYWLANLREALPEAAPDYHTPMRG
jgi:hypothetical protein